MLAIGHAVLASCNSCSRKPSDAPKTSVGNPTVYGGQGMKAVRKIIAVGACGIILGAGMSVFGAAPATARLYAGCDKKIEQMEKQAAKDYQRGKLSAADYEKVQAEIDFHRTLWGC